MSGHVYPKGKNWYVVIEVGEGADRKRRTISVRKELGLDRPALKREARDLLARLQVDQQEGTYIKPSNETVKSYLEKWLTDYAQPNVKQKTFDLYKNMVDKHLVPGLGDTELTKIKPSQLKGFYAKKLQPGGRADGKEGGLSNRTVQYMHMVLRLALSHAIEDELIKYNVSDRVTPPTVKKPKLKFWNREQTKRFLDFTAASSRNNRYYLFYLLALSTGMRRGEILGLRWQDVDTKKNSISIRQNIVHTSAGPLVQDTVKTDAGARTIDISAGLVERLKEHKKRQAKELLAASSNVGRDLGLIFTTQTGNLVAPRNIDRSFKLAIGKYNAQLEKETKKDKLKMEEKLELTLPEMGLHGLRHSYATRLLEDGVHPKVVQERLGHASIKITLDTYSHVVPRLQKEVASLTDDLL